MGVNLKVLDSKEPFFQISQAAKLLGITSDRLRTYEEEGLIKPYRVKGSLSGKRLFTQYDIDYIFLIRKIIKLGVSIPALRILLFSSTIKHSYKSYEKDKEIIELLKEIKKYIDDNKISV